MDREETLLDTVGRLDRITTRLETLLDGNAALGVSGLLARVERIESKLEQQAAKSVSMWQWIIGYVLFVSGTVLAGHGNLMLFGISATAGLIIGVTVWLLAGVFFLSGLGWLKWR